MRGLLSSFLRTVAARIPIPVFLFSTPAMAIADTVVDMPIQSEVVQAAPARTFALSESGVRRFSGEDIQALGDAGYDPNELMEVLPNVQFSDDRFRFGPDEIGNLQPAEVSISGARPGENQFIIDGVGTNNRLDSLSQRSFNQVTASVQSVFLDADLLKEFTVLDANVPAQYGDFLGGVVIAETRDPAFAFGGRIKLDYSSSDFVDYLIEPSRIDRGEPPFAPFPAPTDFTRIRFGIDLDVPVKEGIRTLFSANRAIADVTRGALSSRYFPGRRTRSTLRDNFLAKAVFDLGDRSMLTVSTLWTPYEDQYWRTSRNRQYGGGSTNKIQLNTDWRDRQLEGSISYNTTRNDREEEADHFIYADTPAITDDPFDDRTKLRGGFGDFSSSQEEWKLALTHRWLGDSGEIAAGLNMGFLSAERGRPQTVFGYRDAVPVSLPPGGSIRQANPVPGTVIAQEQILLERNDYRAFSAKVSLFDFAAFIDSKRSFPINDGLTLELALGLRFSYDDFLRNATIAPRTNLTVVIKDSISLSLGANRYFAQNQLLYALREQDPDNFVFKRQLGFDTAANAVTVGEFALQRQTRSTRFSNSNLDTPYSDELVMAVTAPLWNLGEFRTKGLLRFSRDGFARSEPILETGLNQLGETITFERYELTNRGSGQYRSLSLEWAKTVGNSSFTIATTLSENEIARGTDTLLSNTELAQEGERVLFKGELISFNQLNIERENFNSPAYISGTWVANWFEGAFTTALRGRYRPAYDQIVDTRDQRAIAGEPGSPFAVYEVQSLDAQFVVDANLKWRFSMPADTQLELRVNIDNLFNFVPNVPVTRFNPYQQGRSFSFGASLRF